MIKNKDYQWKPHHQIAFEKIIQNLNLADEHLLASRDLHKYLAIHILQDSVETILTTPENKLIQRASRLLSTAEANYSYIEKQLLGLVFAINKFRLLLDPRKFTIRLPDNGLEKAINLVNRTERVDQWLLKMPEGFDTFKFDIDGSIQNKKHMKHKKHVPQEIFYVDGACKANGKPSCRASWAVCAEYDKNLELKGFVIKNPSNQSAELTAAIKACEEAKRRQLNEVTIVTDSKYLFNAATQWIDKWRINDWKDNKNKPVVNKDLFISLMNAKEGLDIDWIHVKGHSDNVGNNRADLIAKSLLGNKTETLFAMTKSTTKFQYGSKEVDELKRRIRLGLDNRFKVIDDTVYYVDIKLPEGSQERIYVPTESRHWLLNLAHNDEQYGGHLGIKKTFRKLIRFWWPKMHQEVENYVKSCHECQQFKQPTGLPPGYLHSIPVSEIYEHIHIDIIGPMTASHQGNVYVITATDAFSKWAVAIPSQVVRTAELIKFVEDWILSVHGKPKRIVTDQGSQFTSKDWKAFISKLGIEHKLTSPYHPQSNGIDERVNGTLMRILRYYVNKYQRDWDDHLKWSLYIYNNTVHDSTGYSPYQILYSRESRSPLRPGILKACNFKDINQLPEDIRLDVYERNKRAQEVQSKYYDRKRSKSKLYVGQLVYIKIHATPTYLSKKFYQKWSGPAEIINLLGDTNDPRAVEIYDFEIQQKKVVAITDVKPMIDLYKLPDRSILNNPKTSDADTFTSDPPIDPYDPSFYVNRDDYNDETDLLKENSIIRTNSPGLDITNITTRGPITSSPRRVTISNDVRTRFYDTQIDAIASDEQHPDEDQQFEDASEYVQEPEPLENQPRQESTVYDYPNNSRIDPTYKPANEAKLLIDVAPRTVTSSQMDKSSSLIPRIGYETRSARRKRLEDLTHHLINKSPHLVSRSSTNIAKTKSSTTSKVDKGQPEDETGNPMQSSGKDKLGTLVHYYEDESEDLIIL